MVEFPRNYPNFSEIVKRDVIELIVLQDCSLMLALSFFLLQLYK